MLGQSSNDNILETLQQRYKLNLPEAEMKKLLKTKDLSNFLSPDFNYNDISKINRNPKNPVHTENYIPPTSTCIIEEGDLSEYYFTFQTKSKQFVFNEIQPIMIENDYKLYNDINSKLEYTEVVVFNGPFDL
ncbi:hypothetical protein HDV06_006416 [Boothiomyces sp. JEL0866]|nr:hypothetical protein HDV06_006416 [Boothiomyces sp. JEL0866]